MGENARGGEGVLVEEEGLFQAIPVPGEMYFCGCLVAIGIAVERIAGMKELKDILNLLMGRLLGMGIIWQ